MIPSSRFGLRLRLVSQIHPPGTSLPLPSSDLRNDGGAQSFCDLLTPKILVACLYLVLRKGGVKRCQHLSGWSAWLPCCLGYLGSLCGRVFWGDLWALWDMLEMPPHCPDPAVSVHVLQLPALCSSLFRTFSCQPAPEGTPLGFSRVYVGHTKFSNFCHPVCGMQASPQCHTLLSF